MENIMELLEKEDGTKAMIQECFKVVAASKRIIIFGAGVGGKTLYDLLDQNGMSDKVIAFSDNNNLKFETTYMTDKLYVIQPDRLVEKCGLDCIILVASSAWDKIAAQLEKYGYERDSIYLFNFAFMNLQYTDKEFIYDHINDFQRAYNRMVDDKSRKIFIDILNYKITKDNRYLYDMQSLVDDEAGQYFAADLFELLPTERFVDIGAYTGDTYRAYNRIYHSRWEAYYGLEADKKVYVELGKVVGKENEKIKIHNIAAWDKKTVLYFEENAGSSTMGEKKLGEEVQADRVDNILGGENVTFIKMDIEGAEYNAINGMRELIQKNAPIIAMCVYHRRDDFYRLTDLLETICPNEYTYYLRQYRFTPTETVCYAIPKKRMKR